MLKSNHSYRPVSAIILSDCFPDGEKFLIVKKPRKKNAWQFPQGGVDAGECFLQAIERELGEECGKSLRMTFVYSWPVGEYQYDFPEDFVRHYGGFIGAKVHFFRGILESGKVEIDNEEIIDYRWAAKEDFHKYFEENYLKVVEDLI